MEVYILMRIYLLTWGITVALFFPDGLSQKFILVRKPWGIIALNC